MSGVALGVVVGAGVPLGLLGLQWLGLVLAEHGPWLLIRLLLRGRPRPPAVDVVKVMCGR